MRGFTLIEMIVVIALIGAIASITAFEDLHSYSRILARTDTDRLVSALAQARSQAMHGVCFTSDCDTPPMHGVLLQEGKAVAFEGSSYKDRVPEADIEYPLDGVASVSGAEEIVFLPISGGPTEAAAITLSNTSGTTWQITIDSSGALQSSVVPDSARLSSS